MANKRKRSDGYKVESKYQKKNRFDEVEEEDVVAEEPQTSYNTNKKPAVLLQNMISARVKLPGPITGELYIWERAGAVVGVDEKDAEGFLAKTLGEKGCCGGTPYRIFQLVK